MVNYYQKNIIDGKNSLKNIIICKFQLNKYINKFSLNKYITLILYIIYEHGHSIEEFLVRKGQTAEEEAAQKHTDT